MIKLTASLLMLLTLTMSTGVFAQSKHQKHHNGAHLHKKHKKVFNVNDIDCMTAALFIEARGEPVKGKLGVAKVIHKRSIEQNKPYCEVLNESGQFNGFSMKRVSILKSKGGDDWQECQQVAIISGKVPDPTNGAIRFQHKSIKIPRGYTITARISNHIFLKKNG